MAMLRLAAALIAGALVLAGSAYAAGLTAVTVTRVVYPGETIPEAALETVSLSRPVRGQIYASDKAEVVGKIARRTLLPRRVIPLNALREPYVVDRGTIVQMVYVDGGLRIVASGVPLEPGSAGDVIRIRNADTGVTISGIVMADGTVRVTGP